MDRMGVQPDILGVMMVEEFKATLDFQEQFALSLLERFGDDGFINGNTYGRETKRWMENIQTTLKKKACEYWGQDYINSIFVEKVACF